MSDVKNFCVPVAFIGDPKRYCANRSVKQNIVSYFLLAECFILDSCDTK